MSSCDALKSFMLQGRVSTCDILRCAARLCAQVHGLQFSRNFSPCLQGLVAQGRIVLECDALRVFLELPPRPDFRRDARGEAGEADSSRGSRARGRDKFHRRQREISVDRESDSDMLNL